MTGKNIIRRNSLGFRASRSRSNFVRTRGIFPGSHGSNLKIIFRKGKMIASGANDGQIQIWDQSRTVAPRIKIQNAHKPMTEISNVTFSYDNTCLSSRGGDGSVKIWDLRNTKKVLVERTDLPSMYHCTQETIQKY